MLNVFETETIIKLISLQWQKNFNELFISNSDKTKTVNNNSNGQLKYTLA